MALGAPFALEGGVEAREAAPAPLEASVVEARFGSLEPLGQVLSTYLVCQAPGRMVLVDLQAAHARIAYDRLRREARARAVVEQPLLLPQSMELDASRAEIAMDSAPQLRAIGIELEHFGGSTFVVKSRPVAIGNASLERLVTDLLDALEAFGDAAMSPDEVTDALVARAARHTAVRAGDRLTPAEVKALLRALDAIDFGAECPQGRPVFVEWSEREIARLFHRA